MQFAEQRRERQCEYLFAIPIADVQDPLAPVLWAGRRDESPDDPNGMLAGFRQIFDVTSTSVQQYPSALEQWK